MARVREFAPIVQVGIRSMSAEELPYADRERIFYPDMNCIMIKPYMQALSESLQGMFI